MLGFFDSGFGGLTVLEAVRRELPAYDYLFLADSARAPYGARSLDVIEDYTRESVDWLFGQGCPVVILACNTASARALRNLQRQYLPRYYPDRRLLGVVRPSVEALAGLPPQSDPDLTPPSDLQGCVAVLGTEGTIASDSFGLELRKLAPRLLLKQQACPLWAALVEAGELSGPGTEWFLRRSLEPVLEQGPMPQRILLGCTHYPLLLPALRKLAPAGVTWLDQGAIVAPRLADWLERHSDFENRLGRGASCRFCTTDDPAWFSERGARLLGKALVAERVHLR